MSNVSHNAEPENEELSELKIKTKWLEVFVYVVISIITLLYIKSALELPGSPSGIGPRGFPLLISVLIGVSLVALFIVSLKAKPEVGVDTYVTINRPLQVALVVATMFVFVIALQWIGPLVSIAVLALLVMWFGGERRYVLLLTLSPLLSIGIYVLFVSVLGVYFD